VRLLIEETTAMEIDSDYRIAIEKFAAILNRAAGGLVSNTHGSPNELLQSTTEPDINPTTSPTLAPAPAPSCLPEGQIFGGTVLFGGGGDCCPGLNCSGFLTARCK
jgi:hypothetical protein